MDHLIGWEHDQASDDQRSQKALQLVDHVLPLDKLLGLNQAAFWTAYRYIQSRTSYMRYSQYAYVHIPLGTRLK